MSTTRQQIKFSKPDFCEGGSFSSAIFNSDIQLSVYSLSCLISVCPPVALLTATYAENWHIWPERGRRITFSEDGVRLFTWRGTPQKQQQQTSCIQLNVYKTSGDTTKNPTDSLGPLTISYSEHDLSFFLSFFLSLFPFPFCLFASETFFF